MLKGEIMLEVENWGGECSVKRDIKRGDGENLCPRLLQTFLENMNKGGRDYRSRKLILAPDDLTEKTCPTSGAHLI